MTQDLGSVSLVQPHKDGGGVGSAMGKVDDAEAEEGGGGGCFQHFLNVQPRKRLVLSSRRREKVVRHSFKPSLLSMKSKSALIS